MKEQYTSFLKMMSDVSKHARNNPALNGIPAFAALQPKLDTVYEKMVTTSKLMDTEDKALSVAVENATEKVIGPLFMVIKGLDICAVKQNNPSLTANLSVSRSELQRATSKTIETKVTAVVKVARENIAELNLYSITEERLTTLVTDTQQLVAASDALLVHQEAKRSLMAEFEQQMEEAKTVLYEMDSIAEIISLTHPSVYKTYCDARNRKESTESLFIITVLNKETGRPEENARVVVESTTRTVKNKPYVLIDRKTGKRGEVRNSKREYDIYKMTIEKIGREPYVQQFTVADSQPLRFEVMLKKLEGLN